MKKKELEKRFSKNVYIRAMERETAGPNLVVPWHDFFEKAVAEAPKSDSEENPLTRNFLESLGMQNVDSVTLGIASPKQGPMKGKGAVSKGGKKIGR